MAYFRLKMFFMLDILDTEYSNFGNLEAFLNRRWFEQACVTFFAHFDKSLRMIQERGTGKQQ